MLRYLVNSGKPHPLKQGKGILVDFDCVILMLPMIVSGVSFGTIVNLILPSVTIVTIFVLTLSYLAYNMTRKSIRLYKNETTVRESEKLGLLTSTLNF